LRSNGAAAEPRKAGYEICLRPVWKKKDI